MKNYEVTIMYTSYATYIIEADTSDQAKELVWDKYHPDDADNCGGSEIYSCEEINET